MIRLAPVCLFVLNAGLFVLTPAVFAAGTAAPAAAAPQAVRLDRNRLLEFHTPNGHVLPARRIDEWESRRQEILKGFLSITGPLPGKERACPLEPETVEEVDCGLYIRRLIRFSPEPGDRVPVYLLLPKSALNGKAKARVALCLHQTHPAGQKVVVGLGRSTNDEYGVELANRGWICAAPPYPQLAEYNPNLKALGYQSGVMKAVWNNQRLLDLIEALPIPGRRPGPVAAIGHSLGGHTAVFTAALDPRVGVVVSSCGLDSFQDYKGGDLTGWTSDRYMPRLKGLTPDAVPFDFQELVGLLAPRGVFLSAPFGDTNFRWQSVMKIEQAAAPVFELYGARRQLRVEHPTCSHLFPPEIRTAAYDFMARALDSLDNHPR